MKHEYLEKYKAAFESVFSSYFSNKVIFEKEDERNLEAFRHQISIVLGFVGDLRGKVDFVMDMDVACKLTSILAGGMEVDELDELVKSAMGELSNMIMGNICTSFSKEGIFMDITPPSIITGEDFTITNLSPTFFHKVSIEGIGQIGFDIAFKNELT